MTNRTASSQSLGEPQLAIPSRTSPSPLYCWDGLAASLDAVKTLDNFSRLKSYQLAPNPVIQLSDSFVTLPLTDHGVEAIKNACKRVVIKDGSQTDHEMDGCWRLGNDQFKLINPAWPSFFNIILDDVRADLDIPESIDTKLHELILHEKGSLSGLKVEASKEQGKIATLSVYLPSVYEGGQILLSYTGKECTFDIAESSMFQTKALAWASSVTYATRNVFSGHRLSLNYDIVAKPASQNSSSNFGRQIESVHTTLRQCIQQDPNFSTKIYLLDHQYSRASMSFSKLLGHDEAVFKVLKELCAQHGLFILLGFFRDNVTTLRVQKADNDTAETIYLVDLINGTDATEIAKDTTFTEAQFLNSQNFKDRLATNAEKPESSSNDKQEEARNDSDAGLILCPKLHLGSYLYPGSKTNFPNMVQLVRDDLDASPDKNRCIGVSLRLLEEIVDSWHNYEPDPSVHSSFIHWAWERKHRNLFIKMISSAIMRGVDPETMNVIAKIINMDGLKSTETNDIRWGKYFDGAICHTHDLQHIALNLQIVEDKIEDGLKSSFRIWKQAVEQHVFRTKAASSLDDVLFFLIRSSLVPALSVAKKKTLRESIYQILSEGQKANLPNAEDIANTIVLCTQQKAALELVDFEGPSYFISPAKRFVTLLDLCLQARLEKSVTSLLDACWANIAPLHEKLDSFPLLPWKTNIRKFLNDLGRLLHVHSFPHRLSTRELFKLFISRYIYSAVPSYPEKLPGWSCKSRGCGCEICVELDKFLRADDLEKKEFPKEHRAHLKTRLPNDGTFTWTLKQPEDDQDAVEFVVHKIKDLEFEKELESYNEALLGVESHFKILRHTYVKGLLADADYRELVMLEGVKNSEGAKQLADYPVVIGEKRQADETWAQDDKPAQKKSSIA
ncbi:hypothetical protein GGR51DRAFT_564072 [Nemania sp. FL0031]|nr:hypothetical protein GGR51DRAFT_564072 [Nemania sp. FL0031]